MRHSNKARRLSVTPTRASILSSGGTLRQALEKQRTPQLHQPLPATVSLVRIANSKLQFHAKMRALAPKILQGSYHARAQSGGEQQTPTRGLMI